MACETVSKTPPMEWYKGIAFPEEGIRIVFIGTSALYALHPDMREQIEAWHSTRVGKDRPDIRSWKEVRIHNDTGAFVQEVTGFLPETLINKRVELEEIYIGQSMGPFPFPVTWIAK